MATGVSARLTPAEGRRFGLTVGGAFLVLSAATWIRGLVPPALALGSMGGALCVAALLMPSRLGGVERIWMRLAAAISRLTGPVAMALVYFGVITPVGLLRRAVAGNPLRHAAPGGTFWKPRRDGGAADMERQF